MATVWQHNSVTQGYVLAPDYELGFFSHFDCLGDSRMVFLCNTMPTAPSSGIVKSI